MLQVDIVLFGWYLTCFGAMAERLIGTDVPLLDKFQQHDYKFTFERGEAISYDKHYVTSLNVITYKFNRTSAVVNASVEFKQDLGHGMEIVVQVYKFASNEYRLFPIRLQFNFCEGVTKNVIGLGDFRKCGTFSGCPVVKNKLYSICKWTPNQSKFPPLIPDGQYMTEFQMVHSSIELFVIRGYGIISRPTKIPE